MRPDDSSTALAAQKRRRLICNMLSSLCFIDSCRILNSGLSIALITSTSLPHCQYNRTCIWPKLLLISSNAEYRHMIVAICCTLSCHMLNNRGSWTEPACAILKSLSRGLDALDFLLAASRSRCG